MPGADEFVSSVALQSDGKVLIGGGFTGVNGLVRNRITRLNTDGSVDVTFNTGTGADAVVSAIRVQPDGNIMIGGAFSTINGQPRGRIARLVGGANRGFGTFDFASSTFTVAENFTNGLVTVVRSGGTSNTVTVNFSTADGTATSGFDYVGTNGTLTFAAGVTHLSFNVPVTDNSVVDGSRTVLLTLSNPTNGATLGGGSSAVLTISDNDAIVGFNPQAYSVNENGGIATINVARAGGTVGTFTVDFFTADATAVAGTHYLATNGTLTFTNGQTNASFTVTILDNLTVEGNKTNLLFLTNAVGSVTIGGGRAVLTIVDNEFGPGVISFATSAFVSSETNASAVITVTRTNGTEGLVSVNYSTVAGGTAAAGTNYTPVSGTFSWPDSDITARTFVVPVIDDFTTNANRTVNLALSGATGGAVLSISNAVLTIADNDSVLGFSATNFNFSESAGLATITVLRGGPAVDTVTVSFAVSNNTATAGADYTATNGVLTFTNGQSSATFLVAVADDLLVEGDETALLFLSNPVAAPAGSATFANTNATLTIVDDEAVVSFQFASYPVSENVGRAPISVQRLGVTNTTVTVDFTTSNSTAIAGLDYTRTNGTLTFAPGVTNLTFAVPITDNLFVNSSKTIQLVLGNVSGPFGTTLIAPSNASLVISDNDTNSPPAGTVDVTFGANLGANGPVYSLAFRTNGQVVLGGNFTTVNGGLVNRVARLNADGTLDQGFNPGLGADTNVFAVAVQDSGAVIIGGEFTTVNGTNRARLARLNLDGSLDLAFNSG